MDYETRTEYGKWLSSIPWTYFFTGTFRGNFTPDGARRAGERFFRPFKQLELACLFIERGSLYGKVHLHGLLQFKPGSLDAGQSIRDRWESDYGYSRVEVPKSGEAVSNYCVKYVLKHAKDETYLIL